MIDLNPDSRLLEAQGATQAAPKPIRPIDYLLHPKTTPKRQKEPKRNKPASFPCPRCRSTNTVANLNYIENNLICRRCSKHFVVADDAIPLEGPSTLYRTSWNRRRRPQRSSHHFKDKPTAAVADDLLSALAAEAAAKLNAKAAQ